MTCVCQHTSMRLAVFSCWCLNHFGLCTSKPASVGSERAACCSGRHLEREPNRTLVRTRAQIDPRTSTPSELTTVSIHPFATICVYSIVQIALRYRMTYVCPFMWLRLRPFLQVGAIHSLQHALTTESEKETRQKMASWAKAADEGHEMVARHGMSPVSEPTFLVLYSRNHCSSFRRIDMRFCQVRFLSANASVSTIAQPKQQKDYIPSRSFTQENYCLSFYHCIFGLFAGYVTLWICSCN
ncbi:hypothetical protein BKA67DRAFT_328489 [Truncatella angustata]|uniref:Secreted protein n=1 Tax=Truncatella angustata TaxID=152316 RepID=A0A9P8ZX69_9PEZI|nr:uncharacterized protein BKA67DRAFT_328489 [Truncatella angustata]KAH6653672.1 hypothetical protein BKA67DRAFT_328489 [Truncatella angustata]